MGKIIGYEVDHSWNRPRGVWRNILNIFGWVKEFFVRGLQGYTKEDTWNFDGYLAKIISNGVLELKNRNLAFPGQDEDSSEENWSKTLTKISKGFAVYEEMCNEFDEKKEEELRKQFKEAQELFKKYFTHLWD